jgi:hypothetical protein
LLDDVRSPEVRLQMPAEPLIKCQGRSGGAIKNPNGNVVPVSEVTLCNQETEEDTGTLADGSSLTNSLALNGLLSASRGPRFC